ncbi:MAG TPA: lyase family protein, partial [Dehalococcoidia bacterium]|nr:lyase family protein [Dehalococcoidia bacterium]
MIERDSHPEMARVWAEEYKYDLWLKVEVAVCEAWGQMGVIPPEDVDKIRRARFDLQRTAQYERETHHDVTAFLRSVADSLGAEARWVHLGLTSYDIVDTALSLRLVEAAGILERDVAALTSVLEKQALRYKDTLM